MAHDGEARVASPDALIDLAAELSRELHPGRRRARFNLQSSLTGDLGLDSLSRAELLLRIERSFGRSVSENAAITAETLGDVWREIERSASTVVPRSVTAPRARDPDVGQLAVPGDARSLPEVLEFHATHHGQRVHLMLDEGGAPSTMTYAELFERSRGVAGALVRAGYRAGDRIGIMLPTGRSYFECFFGALLAGMTPVPLYPPARMAKIEEHLRRQARILHNADARLLITTGAVERLGKVMSSLVDGLAVSSAEAYASAPAIAECKHSEIALLQYTSGSTGDPKGVVLTHANLLANVRAMGESACATSADVIVSWLPLYHDMGLIGAWLGSLYFGCRFVVMSPMRFLTRPVRWLRAIHEHAGTISAAPNFAYELCVSKITDAELEGLDLRSWRMALNGAEAVSASTLRRFAERFARCGLRQETLAPVYGLAECSVGLAFPPQGRGPRIERIDRDLFMRTGEARIVSVNEPRALEIVGCGYALPSHEIRVVDAACRELPDRHEGHLEFRGPSATRGYANNPEANRKLRDGAWYRSGDLAYTAGGEIFVTGRSKDIIVRAGHHIHPEEIEDVLGQLPGVRRGCVAVIGVADPSSGTERVVILVETREMGGAQRRALREHVRTVASGMLDASPDDVVLLPAHALLKTTSGKLRRSACRESYESGKLERSAPSATRQLVHLFLSASLQKPIRALTRLSTWILAAWAWFCLALLTPITWLLVLLGPDLRARWRVVHRAARVLFALTRTPLRLDGDPSLLGRASVLVANHASYLDALALTAVLPNPVRFVVKAELRAFHLLRPALERLEVHYVERAELAASLTDALHARQLARTDAPPLLFFPEGTFTRAPGLRAFHMGAFDAAARTGLSLVPLLIDGTRSILRDGSWVPRRGAIHVRIGPTLRASSRDFQGALELRDAARAWMVAHCSEPDLGQ